MNNKAIRMSVVTALMVLGAGVSAQSQATNNCSFPFPEAKFFIEDQPESPLLIRDLKAELIQNPNEMGYKSIRVTFYFENRSRKKVTTYIWDNPMPDESKWPSGGISSQELLPGESHRHKNVYHTQQGPPVVLRVTEVVFADGSKWKAPRYDRKKALSSTPMCVVPEKWPNIRTKRNLEAEGWTRPIFSDRVTKTIDGKSLLIKGIKVQVKLHELRRERLDTIPTCPPSEMFERVTGKNRDFDFDVEKYRSFAVRNRIFAYLISYEFVDEVGQYEIGASTASFYLDLNGDGRFALQCDQGNVAPTLPKWIVKLDSTK